MLEKVSNITELQQAGQDPSGFFLSLANVANPAAKKLAIARLRPALNSTLRSLGLVFSDIQPVLDEVLSVEALQMAVVDPETLLPLSSATGPCRVLGAAWLGKTRLIDNVGV